MNSPLSLAHQASSYRPAFEFAAAGGALESTMAIGPSSGWFAPDRLRRRLPSKFHQRLLALVRGPKLLLELLLTLSARS